MLSGVFFGICDVFLVRGVVLCFFRGIDWSGVSGFAVLLRIIVGGVVLGWGVRWVAFGVLAVG